MPTITQQFATPISNLFNTFTIQLLGQYAGLSLVFVLWLVLVILQAIGVNGVLSNAGLIPQKSGVGALVFVLFMAFFQQEYYFSVIFWINFLFIAAAHYALQSYNQRNFAYLFNMGLSVGVGIFSLFSVLGLAFLPLIYIFNTRIFNWKEWIVVLAGLTMPWYLSFVFLYLTDQLYWFNNIVFIPHEVAIFHHKIFWIGGAIMLFIFVSLLLPNLLMQYRRLIIKNRKYVMFFLWWIILLIANLIVIQFDSVLAYLPLFVVPFGFILAVRIQNMPNSIWIETAHIVLLLLVVLLPYLL